MVGPVQSPGQRFASCSHGLEELTVQRGPGARCGTGHGAVVAEEVAGKSRCRRCPGAGERGGGEGVLSAGGGVSVGGEDGGGTLPGGRLGKCSKLAVPWPLHL